MSAITTHVLDTARGRPAMGVPVVLERRLGPDEWEGISRGETDSDGRLRSLLPDAAPLPPGTYRLIFDTRALLRATASAQLLPASDHRL